MTTNKTKLLNMSQLLAMTGKITQFPITEAPVNEEKPKEIGFVYAKEFTVADRASLIKMINGDDTRIAAAYIIHGVCDNEGDLLFKENDGNTFEDIISSIRNMPDHTVGQMLAAVMSVNDMDEKKTAKN